MKESITRKITAIVLVLTGIVIPVLSMIYYLVSLFLNWKDWSSDVRDLWNE